MAEEKSITPCQGCRDNFYNRGEKRCWSLDSAVMATLYRIGTWTDPTSKGAFTEIKAYNCYHEEGASIVKGVPAFVKAEDVNVPAS